MMAADFLDKKLTGCALKGVQLDNEHKDIYGFLPDEQLPAYCEYSSASDSGNGAICEYSGELVSNMQACPLVIPATRRKSEPKKAVIRKPSKGITWVFMRTRNKHHMLKSNSVSYCRDSFITLRLFHVENMPETCICIHCLKAFKAERIKIAEDKAKYRPSKRFKESEKRLK